MIYFNNAATSWPKFPSTLHAMQYALEKGQVYCGRDTADFLNTEKKIFQLRENLGSFFLNAKEPHEICFSSSSTVALDELILGRAEYLRKKGRLHDGFILCSDREHNSVMRPLQHLKEAYGIRFVPVKADGGNVRISDIKEILRARKESAPLFAVFSQVSNVTGDVLNAEELGSFFKSSDIPFILDATQGIGITPVNVETMHCSAVAFAGHKGLNGPQGTGAFYIRNGFHIEPILFGGTGHASSKIAPPVRFPDSFEVGTPPVHDLIGFADAVKRIKDISGSFYKKKILHITQYCHDEIARIEGYHVFGQDTKASPILSFVSDKDSPEAVADYLWLSQKINCRSGLLCSPMGVHALGQDSVVRFSFGFYNTVEEVDIAVDALRRLRKEKL